MTTDFRLAPDPADAGLIRHGADVAILNALATSTLLLRVSRDHATASREAATAILPHAQALRATAERIERRIAQLAAGPR